MSDFHLALLTYINTWTIVSFIISIFSLWLLFTDMSSNSALTRECRLSRQGASIYLVLLAVLLVLRMVV